MTWTGAWIRALVIFAFFVIATVWLPDVVVDALGGGSTVLRDVVVTLVWGGGLVLGLWGLRRMQGRGQI